MKYIIYGLIDPRSKMIRYIGRSSSGFSHPNNYKSPSMLKNNTYRTNWIKSLFAYNLVYDVVALQVTETSDNLNALEIWWIAYARCLGWPLTNLTNGGEGLNGYKLTAETKSKISNANKGRKPTPEALTANARAQLGRKHSEETKNKMRESAIARQADPALREHMRLRSTGYKHTPETIQKMKNPRIKAHPPRTAKTKERLREVSLKRIRNVDGTFT